MQLYTINTGNFKLDGGAMFGVVPKSIWNKLNPADENNLCSWAMRCLLVQDGNRLILIDNGIGNKQDEKFLRHYYLHGEDTLDTSLEKKGFTATISRMYFLRTCILIIAGEVLCGREINWCLPLKTLPTGVTCVT